MSAFIHNVTFDAGDPRLLGRFWSQVTGYAVVDERDDFVRLRAPDDHGVRHILFLRVDDPTPGKNRMHVDLAAREPQDEIERLLRLGASLVDLPIAGQPRWRDRKSTRLNSSHTVISYAVFCLKKKKNHQEPPLFSQKKKQKKTKHQ